MKFGDKGINWEELCKKEIFGPFAPQSGFFWDPSNVNLSRMSYAKNSLCSRGQNNTMKTALVKKLLKQGTQLQRFIGRHTSISIGNQNEALQSILALNLSPKKKKVIKPTVKTLLPKVHILRVNIS